MAEFNFSQAREAAEKEYNLGKGQYFKPKDGANRIRLVSACLPHESVFKGRKTFKWLCQVIDRKDGAIKPYFMPDTIYKMIADLQMDPEYSFNEVPMPYDITINATGAGTRDVVYTVFPARESIPLTESELQALKEAPTVQELQQKVRENEKKDAPQEPFIEDVPPAQQSGDEINVEDIPF